MGYGNDSDGQSSVTKSGINTQNTQITDEAKQIQLTGQTAEQTKASIHTDTTTNTAQTHSGHLKNVFDRERVESELNLQRTVSQQFSQTSQQINSEINKHLDGLKEQLDKGEISQTDYDEQVRNWQRGKILLNMIASGLSAPTQSGAGIAAASASPVLSYQIGQYFKGKNAEGTGTHILAHAILGAAVAAAGDNNALAGAMSAAGAEAAAPKISDWLYGTHDPEKMTAEQKETVSAITNLLGAATGAAVGNSATNAAQGSLNAQSAVGNNNNNGGRRRPDRNPLWTEAQARQHELNAAKINFLINQIRRIEPNFRGIASLRNPNRPITNEEVQSYEQYLNRIRPRNSIVLGQTSFATNLPPISGRLNINTTLNELARDSMLNQLGEAFNARPRVNGNLDARNINLQVGLRTVRPNPAASQKGMPVYSNMSEQEIFSVYQQYTGNQPNFRNMPGKGILASTTIQSGSWQGSTVVLRNFSNTYNETKARWTIEFQRPPASINSQRLELKFQ